MNVTPPEKIVVLGLMSHFPVAGVVWQTIHYLVGLQRLGYDVFYVEAHGCAPTKLMRSPDDDGSARAAEYISQAMQRFGFEGRWAYDSRYNDRRIFGMSESQLATLYREAALIINLHGATLPLPEHTATGRLVYLETDPVEVQIDLHHGRPQTIEYLEQHCAFFSFGENLGHPDCRLPASDRFTFLPTRQPVVMDFWEPFGVGDAAVFTTIGNWRQPWRERKFAGEIYQWSKHFEFLKFIDLPGRTTQPFELALSSYEEADRQMLEAKGWRVRHALDISHGSQIDAYRKYIGESRGEFTVAKDQNIRLRSGWFSDRAATYLAAGRPVITQETGFSNCLPTGQGLFAFSTMDEAVNAVEAINADYPRHRRAALEIAREHFSHEVVLKKLLAEIGVARARPPKKRFQIPDDLVLSPTSRWPTRLPEETVRAVTDWPPPAATAAPDKKRFSIVIVTHNNLVFTKLCLTSVLLNTGNPHYEVIVVDNASTDGTREYLRSIPRVNLLGNEDNRGFAAANNQGIAAATGEIIVLLNNDTMVLPGWLAGLERALNDAAVGLVGPVTNRTCNEAQIDAPYRTYGELRAFARQLKGAPTELPMLALFCAAMRREVFERVGPLDERFAIGMFEDDDYALRVRQAGYRIVCAEDTFVHHFGQASIGELCATGEYDKVYEANRQRFEEKWGVKWQPQKRRLTPEYDELRHHIREVVAKRLPAEAKVIVVSKGDDELLPKNGWHFPQGFVYPADSSEAIAQLEALRAKGGSHLVFPKPGFWWLDHYKEFAAHLGQPLYRDESCAVYALQRIHLSRQAAPKRVTAILATRNEERFITGCLDHLIAQGVQVYLIDNGSTDQTVALAEQFRGRGLLEIEHRPFDGRFNLPGILRRKEELAATLDTDWLMHVDADEIYLPPKTDWTLAQALAAVEAAGYNAVNFHEFVFIPTRESPDHDHPDYRETMRWYYPFEPRCPWRVKAWKRQPGPVDLANSGGHRVRFPGLRLCPEFFVMKHYQFLSVAHAREKYGARHHDPAALQAMLHGGPQGWREQYDGAEFPLPAAAELRTYQSDEQLDATSPRTRHHLEEALQGLLEVRA